MIESISNLKKDTKELSKTVKLEASNLKLTAVSSVTSTSSTTTKLTTLSSTSKFSKQITKDNHIYVIKYDYDLNNETIKIPKNTVLSFQGGSIKNGTIVGNNSSIWAEHKIFYNVNVLGTWKCPGNAGWFANGCEITETPTNVCYIQNKVDESKELQFALDSDFRELNFPTSIYYIGSTLVLKKEKRLIMHGTNMKLSMQQCAPTIKNTTILFTDKDIDILDLSVNETNYHNTIDIIGGNFDTSLCNEYTASCIKVLADNNQKIWGLTINTNIKGKFGATTGIGIDINPIENKEMAGNKAYVTQVRINSSIQDFGIGIKAMNYMKAEEGLFYNWCTDLVIDGYIGNCPLCIDTNVDCDIKAMLQAGYYFDEKENGQALVRYTGVAGSMSSNVFDILLQGYGGKWANQYALETTNLGSKFIPYGRFNAFLVEARWLKKPVVKGVLYNNITEQIYNKVA